MPSTDRPTRRQRLGALLRVEPDLEGGVAETRRLPLRTIIRRFWPRLRPVRWWLVLLIVILAIGPLVGVAEVALFATLVDEVLFQQQDDHPVGRTNRREMIMARSKLFAALAPATATADTTRRSRSRRSRSRSRG